MTVLIIQQIDQKAEAYHLSKQFHDFVPSSRWNNRCEESAPDYVVGLIDWLRRESKLVGIGFNPFHEAAWVLETALENVEIELNRRLLVYFGDSEAFNDKESKDQVLRRVCLYSTNEGAIMLVVDLEDAGSTLDWICKNTKEFPF